MSLFRVKYLSFFFILISIFSFLNIIYSYYFNLYLNLNTYYFSLFPSLFIGLIFYKIKEVNKKELEELVKDLSSNLKSKSSAKLAKSGDDKLKKDTKSEDKSKSTKKISKK